MMKVQLYHENKIICFSSGDFMAFIINNDGDIDCKTFTSLSTAQKWIDRYGTQLARCEEV